MIDSRIAFAEQNSLKADVTVPQVGDTVEVHVNIVEGQKSRTQKFVGDVICKKGRGPTQNFTVRRLVAGEGVERVFPVHSPSIEKVVIKRNGRVRRAKLYYLRDRVGKATRITEKRAPTKKERAADEAKAAKKQDKAA
jgi:large subunit ribosomal protein L19